MEIQVVLSLLAIMSAAAVALFCDYRRSRDTRLREALVELKVRRAESENLGSRGPETPSEMKDEPGGDASATPEISVRRGPRKGPVPPPSPEALSPTQAREQPEEAEMTPNKSLSEWLIQRAAARAAEKAAAEDVAPQPGAPVEVPANVLESSFLGAIRTGAATAPPEQNAPSIPTAIVPARMPESARVPGIAAQFSSQVPEPADPAAVIAARGELRAQVAEPSVPASRLPADVVTEPPEQGRGVDFPAKLGEPSIPTAAVPARVPESARVPGMAAQFSSQVAEPLVPTARVPLGIVENAPVPSAAAEGQAKLVELPVPIGRFEPVVVDEFLWQSLFSSEPPAKPPETVFQITPGSAHRPGEAGLPPGFHDTATLERVMEGQPTFSGLVVAIGVGQADARLPQDEHILGTIRDFISGLLRKNEFCCRTQEDEFVMVCPQETGLDAQRRLSFLSETLWDYQLQTLGSFSILFSLGGVDVQEESLQEAIASAKERMAETRRNRKLLPIPAGGRRRTMA